MAFLDRDFLFDFDHNDKPMGTTYDGEIDIDIINVLRESATEDNWYEKIAAKLGLDAKYVQLIQHYLSHVDLVEYGASPRGAWITDTGRKYLKFLEENSAR